MKRKNNKNIIRNQKQNKMVKFYLKNKNKIKK